MSHSPLRRLAPALAAAMAITLAACGGGGDTAATPASDATSDAASSAPASPSATASPSTSDEPAGFPVTVTDDTGEVEIAEQPQSIVSVSPTGTEILFAIGAGDEVVAVDEFSYYPEEAPVTDLSGFQPNVEAILGYEPDLVVSSGFEQDVADGLTEAGVTVLQYTAATDLEGAFTQFEELGLATGNDASATVDELRAELEEIGDAVDVEPGLTYYHELGSDLYSATSDTFIGAIYGMFDMENIADQAGGDAGDYPQLSAEFIVEQDPDLVFLAGGEVDEFEGREAFTELSAVQDGDVTAIDPDIASRWGPRMVDFARTVADALQG